MSKKEITMSKKTELLVQAIEIKLEELLWVDSRYKDAKAEVMLLITHQQLREALGLRCLRDAAVIQFIEQINALQCVRCTTEGASVDSRTMIISICAANRRARVVIPIQNLGLAQFADSVSEEASVNTNPQEK